MIISKCGYACSECLFLGELCEGCTLDNPISRSCKAIVCLAQKDYKNCLKCSRHGECKVLVNAVYYCPCRHSVTTALRHKFKERGVC